MLQRQGKKDPIEVNPIPKVYRLRIALLSFCPIPVNRMGRGQQTSEKGQHLRSLNHPTSPRTKGRWLTDPTRSYHLFSPSINVLLTRLPPQTEVAPIKPIIRNFKIFFSFLINKPSFIICQFLDICLSNTFLGMHFP